MSSLLGRSPIRILFLTLIALLPLQTIFFRYGIAWKPWLLLLAITALLDVYESRGLPWSRMAGVGSAVFLVAVLASFHPDSSETFIRLFLALGAGVLLMLLVGRHAQPMDDMLRVIFYSGAAMALTAFVLGIITNGALGAGAIETVNALPFVDRVNKPAYLSSGFLALTNWHQDPGYSALWTNVWAFLAIVAWARGAVMAPRWLAAVVVGGLMTATFLTFSRTGWAGLVIAVGAAAYVAWRDRPEVKRRGIALIGMAIAAAVGLIGLQALFDAPDVGGDIRDAVKFRASYLLTLGQIDLGEEGVVDPTLVVDDNRVDVWEAYFDRYGESPVRGIGLGSGWAEQGLQEPHNLGVQLLVETGLIGLLGFLILMFMLGVRKDRLAGALLFVVLMAGFTQTLLFEAVLWFALGFWLGSSPEERDGTEEAERLSSLRWRRPIPG